MDEHEHRIGKQPVIMQSGHFNSTGAQSRYEGIGLLLQNYRFSQVQSVASAVQILEREQSGNGQGGSRSSALD